MPVSHSVFAVVVAPPWPQEAPERWHVVHDLSRGRDSSAETSVRSTSGTPREHVYAGQMVSSPHPQIHYY